MELLPPGFRHHSEKWPQTPCKILKWKNANNMVNRSGQELATYNITFEWISGAKNKAADCLSRLVEQLPATPTTINMLTVTYTDGPAFNTRSQTKQDHTASNSTVPLGITPDISPVTSPTPNLLWQRDWKLYSRCRRLIHSANAYLNNYSMEKHHNMKQTFSLTSEDCCINT